MNLQSAATTPRNRRYGVTDFAKATGVSVDTVRRWDRTGVLTAQRTEGGWRIYTDADVTRARSYRARQH